MSQPNRPTLRIVRLKKAKSGSKTFGSPAAKPLPGAKGNRGRRVRALLRPKGGDYDLQVRKGKRWVKLLNNSPRAALRLRGRVGRTYRLRARVASAATIESAWRSRKVRF